MNWLEALILGIVQGLTEFLPVSSSGHIEIGQVLLGTASEENLAFAVIVHIATVVSTMVVLWNEVSKIFRGTFTSLQWNAEKDYAAKILVSMIPVFIVGVFFKEQVENLFGNGLMLVGVCLMITALLLALSEWLQSKRQGNGHEITYRDAIVIVLRLFCQSSAVSCRRRRGNGSRCP
jgi:undecaprenyl-diphosphatase